MVGCDNKAIRDDFCYLMNDMKRTFYSSFFINDQIIKFTTLSLKPSYAKYIQGHL